MNQTKVKVQTKEDIKKAENTQRQHEIGLLKILAQKYPSDLQKLARKLQKQVA